MIVNSLYRLCLFNWFFALFWLSVVYYRANLKDIKDGLVQQIQKTAKLSPYMDNNVEGVVKQMDR